MAWAELLAEGVSEEFLPLLRLIVKSYISDLDAFEAAVIENVHRDNEDDISKARKLRQYLNRMRDSAKMRERARVIFNIKSMPAMEALLKLQADCA